ncbi:hypothetical protein ES288_D13G263000v1 [Gossypium darwinii]|uniref:Uncharacterized protein n=1 Tax=Gossypium darwinii TaxID=34276 RepID=A0A5D2A3I8_GOSDA|nr:hypothetical protein ES288_D13G263000v1 [Gossypium darwinii]
MFIAMASSANLHCTNATDKQISYANNSSLQKKVLLKTRPFLEDTIKDMLSKMVPVPCIKVADLGCASGPNTFFPTCEVMDIIASVCRQAHWESPELRVFLNDFPQNDFNTVFKSIPAFNGKPCFVAGVAGSFYQRLFPSKSIHFVHSSYWLHWLSKVPGGVENKRNVYIAKSSPPNVSKAYFEQFRDDFSRVLRFRSEEMITGGRILPLTSLVGALLIPQAKTVVLYGVYSQNRSSTWWPRDVLGTLQKHMEPKKNNRKKTTGPKKTSLEKPKQRSVFDYCENKSSRSKSSESHASKTAKMAIKAQSPAKTLIREDSPIDIRQG